MAKDRGDKEKKEKKEKKRSETDGVHKKSKKEKKNAELLEKAVEQELSSKTPETEVAVQDVAMTNGDERPLGALVPFANPLAEDKVAKKVLKSVKKAAGNKSLKRGVKEVVKAVRKSPTPSANAAITTPTAIVVLAADISPMDVISHIPVLCEDHGIPYIYVSSRAELGNAGATKRPTSVVMVLPKGGKNKKKDDKESEDFSAVYDELVKVVQKETKKVKI
ncbi:ribosome biogenesis protein Nhp2 [Arthroderma uncinatum]|uniref:ribosome biogenesis protein Nhp2 n=1 Tax=Arthroderma uncinatum TaxID=74035 RepID=UPI00144A6735|nr:ribosome biogenesis protein Nhp2 [Arthroderma uncinatum]KAF3490766.1 ribosome biogenesis protein Nhp2 [Arthroderma uncinatum]